MYKYNIIVDYILKPLPELKEEILKSPTDTSDVDIDTANFDMQLEFGRSKTERYRSDTNDRKWLAEWATAVVSLWLMAVIILLASKERFRLSDAVLVTLLGTTTLNVLGISFIVLRGHFKSDKDPF